jgi:hypothetical protein
MENLMDRFKHKNPFKNPVPEKKSYISDKK